MKSKVLLLASLSVMGASQLKAQLNVGATGTPDASAILQLSSTTKGLRLPNVALSTTTTFTLTTATSAAAAVGMTVYNTTAGITSSNAAYPATGVGAYTWDGTGWLASKSASANNIYTNDGTLVAARTVTLGTNNLTLTGAGNLYKFSGAAGTTSVSAIGRTTSELDMGVTGGSGQAFGGTVAGDGWVRNLTGNMHIGTYAANDMVFYSSNVERMRLNSAGYMGIGTSASYAPLQFASTIANRKIVLYDAGINAANDSAFYGFGVNSSFLRYQAPTGGSHIFYINKSPLLKIDPTGAIYSYNPLSGGSNSGFYVSDRTRARTNAIYSLDGVFRMYGDLHGDLLTVDSIGTFGLPKYGKGTFTTGTAAYFLAVDANGNMLEQSLNSGTAPNIYNVDGTISSSRTVSMNGNTLNFAGTAGTFTFNNTGNTFSTSANNLQLSQTTDQNGPSTLLLENRGGLAGLLITTGNLTTGASSSGGAVTDIAMQTGGGGTSNIPVHQVNMRAEARTPYIFGHYNYSKDTTELQLGKTAGSLAGSTTFGPGLVVGDNYVISRANLGIGTAANDSVRTSLSITPSSSAAKITLYDAGSTTSHYGFGVTGGQLNYDVTPTAAHVFYTGGKNGTGTEIIRMNNTGTHINGSNMLEFGTGYTKESRAGTMGYGLYSPDALDIVGAGTAVGSRLIRIFDNAIISGTLSVSGTNVTSDVRLKKNFVSLHNALGKVMQLEAYSYDKKTSLASTNYDQKEMGFIAQDIRKVFPELVKEDNGADKLLSVNYTALIPLLTKAIQEQQLQNDVQVALSATQKAEIADLKKENVAILAQNATITAQLAEVKEMKTAMAEMRKELNKMAVVKIAGSNTASK